MTKLRRLLWTPRTSREEEFHVWAVEKWKSKRRDFHFSTGPDSLRQQGGNHFLKKTRVGICRLEKGDISNEA